MAMMAAFDDPFHDVASRAGRERRLHDLTVGVGGEADDGGVRQACGDRLSVSDSDSDS
jgi:hypothetical protein